MSTPSCAKTVAPLDQMVTAPPPAVTSGRFSKTVTSCPSRSKPRAMEIPPTPAPTTKTRKGLISYLQPLLRCTRKIRSPAHALHGCLLMGAPHRVQREPQRMHGVVQPG